MPETDGAGRGRKDVEVGGKLRRQLDAVGFVRCDGQLVIDLWAVEVGEAGREVGLCGLFAD